MSKEDFINKKLDSIDRQIKEGKRKLLNVDQGLGKYAKHVK